MKTVQKRGQRRISVLYSLPSIKDEGKDDKKRVAAYCRVSSSSDEQMGSYRAQVTYYEKYIKEHLEYVFAGIYADEGISGTDIRKREAFKQMMQDARDGHIGMVITKSISRFGRNTLDCLNSIRELKELGVDIYFEKENIHTMRSEGEILITLISAVAQNESLALSENIKWGKRRKYEKGDIGSIPWKNITGYDKDENGEVAIVEEQAAIVRRVFREFLDGYGPDKIARNLNEENIPHVMNGKKWAYKHIKDILTNEKYKGDVKFQSRYTLDPLTKKRSENNGQLPQYYCEDSHPAIVDRTIWECVHLELKRQKRFCTDHFISSYHHSHFEKTFPLTNRITCGNCGHVYLIRTSDRVAEKGTKYYACQKYQSSYHRLPEPGSCINGSVITPYTAQELYIRAWNHLVNEKERYMPDWQQIISGEDILKAYRTKELISLIEEIGNIDKMSYELMLKTLDHIEISNEGKAEVIFLAGMRIKFND